jgi:ATP-binding cassette, subfamily C (CFTR/MRP), member 1
VLHSRALWRALAAAYGGPYALAAALKLLQDCLAFLQPQLLRRLLVFISDYQSARNNGEEPPSAYQGFAIAAVMFVAALAQTMILHQVFLPKY